MNTTTAKNLWHQSGNSYSKPVFTYTGRALFTYRGVQVFKNPAGSWDYILNGAAITQRAGFSKDKAPAIIDALLSGRDEYAGAAVMAHIQASAN